MVSALRNHLADHIRNDLPSLSDCRFVIWGTGNTAQLYQNGLSRFSEAHPWFQITAYCDNNPKKWGTEFFGKPVISPNQLLRKYTNRREQKVVVLICAQTHNAVKEICAQLNQETIQYYLIDELILKTDSDKVLQCFDLLSDDSSKAVYVEHILARITGKEELTDIPIAPLPYFSHPMLKSANPVRFVDCGAYNGDTLEALLMTYGGKIKKYIAFEPDMLNYLALKETAKRMEKQWNLDKSVFSLYNCAVSDKDGVTGFVQTESKGEGKSYVSLTDEQLDGDACKIVSLDTYLEEPYTILKADIESYEYKMLLGAEKGIKKFRPIIAVCIYHNAVDLYSIPLLIHKFDPAYTFSVMKHSGQYDDTILYCRCEE